MARDGAMSVRYIDAFVSDVTRRPLNADEFYKLKRDVICRASLTMDNVRKVIASRYQAGRYNKVLEEIPTELQKTSVRSNLEDIGISLP